ncbi:MULTISPECIES: helix-turn-helix domain-containing protein [unclassified Coleofasciculus]|uniref:helix-turn-helix domain-containing protein n=1 Tax=unclassified Coleofasciculus TaxID=2692782 RepID=UPI0018828795|nr:MULTISPECIES: helix-turn-helix transcriptional regulator [unclassified Coleofasciculus]MBE9124775.1 helix-turn-helix transcriptional regulator [Coleofasciculus sp. LEGE 07081]MBE9148227.1 helix-turn-helix transcriptional regulator [Coleofasciculus sp. LEGE 07092]
MEKEPRIRWHFRRWQAEKNVSNGELAKTLKVSYNTVSRWKQSDYLPKLDDRMLAKICLFFNIDISDLLSLEKESD